ncbi:hypothetical protein [Paenibacillus silvestris]|uniref:hypothetical protein n=1 Tax=Paenibacillus silvestris TaxID=2606219 RepID=UPI0013730861|nr:hypothetical protein [Paenibacillus silvestris]
MKANFGVGLFALGAVEGAAGRERAEGAEADAEAGAGADAGAEAGAEARSKKQNLRLQLDWGTTGRYFREICAFTLGGELCSVISIQSADIPPIT